MKLIRDLFLCLCLAECLGFIATLVLHQEFSNLKYFAAIVCLFMGLA